MDDIATLRDEICRLMRRDQDRLDQIKNLQSELNLVKNIIDPKRTNEQPQATSKYGQRSEAGTDTNGLSRSWSQMTGDSQFDAKDTSERWPLPLEDYRRYGRQLIMPEVGLEGQLSLKKARVLIVGIGGLGCPAGAYLAGAGVGTIGLIDGDTVEVSNLHRQILHDSSKIGMLKVDSARQYLQCLNPTLTYTVHQDRLNPETALGIIDNYDVVLDCTDNPQSRYVISDGCVLSGKPLVSASALKAEGQLMVLNDPPLPPGNATGGPCYRCVFPKPPPADQVVGCGEGGILGPVVGTMGVLQALETIKMLTKKRDTLATSPSLLLFSAYASTSFRSIRLRSRRDRCPACSAEATITRESLHSGSFDYVQFCGSRTPLDLLRETERVSAKDLASAYNSDTKCNHSLVDVRERAEFELCNIPGSLNIAFSSLHARSPGQPKLPDEATNQLKSIENEGPIYVICRLGNDSQIAVKAFKEAGLDEGGQRFVGDVQGGFQAWKRDVDPNWPEY